MSENVSVKPGRRWPPRLLLWLSGALVACGAGAPARGWAQVTTLWPEVAALLAPEAGLGSGSGTLLRLRPAAAWNLGGGGLPGTRPDPLEDPAGMLAPDLPLLHIHGGGQTTYRARRTPLEGVWVTGGISAVQGALPLGSSSDRLLWGISSRRAATRFGYRGDQGGVERDRQGGHAWLGLRGGLARWQWAAVGGTPVAGAGRGPEGGLAASGPIIFGLSGRLWAGSIGLQEQFRLFYRDSEARVEGSVRRTVLGGSLAARRADWQSEVTLEQARGTPAATGSSVHHLRLHPDLTRLEWRFSGLSGHLLAAAGRGWGDHRYEIDYQGLRYTRLVARERRAWLRVGWRPRGERDPLLLRAGWSRTGIEAGGLAEFWPFTPATLDLFGLRRNVIADGRAHVLWLGAEREWGVPASGVMRLLTVIDLHHLRTDGRMTSWEPLVLGLGRKNVWNDRITVATITLFDLGLRGEWAPGRGIVVEAGGAQLLPLAVSTRPRIESETPRPPGPEKVPHRITTAGQRLWIALRFTGGR